MLLFLFDFLVITSFTDGVNRECKSIVDVRLPVCLSVCPSVRLFPLYLLNRLTFKREFLFVCGS